MTSFQAETIARAAAATPIDTALADRARVEHRRPFPELATMWLYGACLDLYPNLPPAESPDRARYMWSKMGPCLEAIVNGYRLALPPESIGNETTLIDYEQRLAQASRATDTPGSANTYEAAGHLPDNADGVLMPWAIKPMKILHAQDRPLSAFFFGIVAAGCRFGAPAKDGSDQSNQETSNVLRSPLVFARAVIDKVLPIHLQSVPHLSTLGGLTPRAYEEALSRLEGELKNKHDDGRPTRGKIYHHRRGDFLEIA